MQGNPGVLLKSVVVGVLAILVAGAALPAVSSGSLKGAQEVTVSSGPAKAVVGTGKWSFSFHDRRRNAILREQPGGGSGPLGRLGFNLNGTWKHATRVKKIWKRGKVQHLRVATQSSRDIKVEVTPASHGSIRLSASIIGSSKNVEAIGMSFRAPKRERYLGFGERSNAVDQRGKVVENWVGEGPYESAEYPAVKNFVPEWGLRDREDATYFPMPWLLSSTGYGVLVENTAPSYFHLGTDRKDSWRVELVRRVEGLAQQPADAPAPRTINLRFFAGPKPADVVRRLSGATGRQPRSAPFFFGPWVQPKGTPLETISKLGENDIPTSLLQTYLHYLPCQDQVGKEAAQRQLTSQVHESGLAITTYFNPMFCTSRPPFNWYNRFGYLTSKRDGSPYEYDYLRYRVAQFDFSSREAGTAYGDLLREALDHGYDGWMEDFGEYTPPDSITADGNPGMFEHNRYPQRYHCTAHEQTKRHERPLARFVRSGFSGSAACSPIVWGGDPNTEWGFDGLRSAIQNGLSMGLSGVGVWGSDIGGFFSILSDPLSNELLTRWVQFGAFSGVMRNQADGLQVDDRHRPQVLDPGQIENWRLYSKLRTQLYPYVSGAARQYRESGMPIMRAMVLDFPNDPVAPTLEDQYMFGNDLLVAPVVNPGATDREVYLPKGKWVDFWRTFGFDQASGAFEAGSTSLKNGGGWRRLPAPAEQIPLLVRAGGMLTMLDSDVDTLSSFGSDNSVIRLRDRPVRTLYAFPRGITTGRFENQGQINSVESKGSLSLQIQDSRSHPWRVKVAMKTLKNPFATRCVKLNGKVLSTASGDWQATGDQVTIDLPKAAKRFGLKLSSRRCS